jgi:hypothetical protein
VLRSGSFAFCHPRTASSRCLCHQGRSSGRRKKSYRYDAYAAPTTERPVNVVDTGAIASTRA